MIYIFLASNQPSIIVTGQLSESDARERAAEHLECTVEDIEDWDVYLTSAFEVID